MSLLNLACSMQPDKQGEEGGREAGRLAFLGTEDGRVQDRAQNHMNRLPHSGTYFQLPRDIHIHPDPL